MPNILESDYLKIRDALIAISDDMPILVCGHNDVDADCIGAVNALVLFLRKLGKKAFALMDKGELVAHPWFHPGAYVVDKFENSADSYVFIMLDSNRQRRLNKAFTHYFDDASFTINIDHHENNQGESDLIWAVSECSSTCELLCHLLFSFDVDLDSDIAALLYTGIVSDTMGFAINNVTEETFLACSRLLKYEIDTNQIIRNVLLEHSLEELNTLQHLLAGIQFDEFHYIIIDANLPYFKTLKTTAMLKSILLL